MKVAFQGRIYEVSWVHGPSTIGQGKQKRVLVHQSGYTNCTIQWVATPDVKAEGFARQAPGDMYCKERGRKISLGRALLKLFPFSKEARTIFWHTYFDHTNQASKITDITLRERVINAQQK